LTASLEPHNQRQQSLRKDIIWQLGSSISSKFQLKLNVYQIEKGGEWYLFKHHERRATQRRGGDGRGHL